MTWYQCLVTVLACYVLRQASRYLPGKISFPELDLDINIMKQLLPLSAVFVGMITLNNLCLKNVGVSFYYIGRQDVEGGDPELSDRDISGASQQSSMFY